VLISLCELVVSLVAFNAARSFYSLRLCSYIKTWGSTSDPEVVDTLYSN
jgi:hypothetical protein